MEEAHPIPKLDAMPESPAAPLPTDQSPATQHWVLTVSCQDQPGIVHAVTGACSAGGGNITELSQFSSVDTGRFFMRIEVDSALDGATFSELLTGVASELGAEWSLHEAGHRVRTLVLASKAGHCLNDLLYRQRSGQLPIEIPRVLANHPDLGGLAGFYGIPFEDHVVLPETKPAFEARVRELVEAHDIELVVLARYMQILSPELCDDLAGRAINIHHSFLPGFKGANPYRQAHERGVKLIGATAHFVTPDLDEGPIIEQNVRRVDHSRTVRQLVEIGQDEESRTLSAAVQLFAERRVFLDGVRTVIL